MIKARAIAIRCLCPPENSCMYLFLSVAESPTSSKTFSILSSIFLASRGSLIRKKGSFIRVETLCLGLKEPYGSWKTT